MRGRQLIAARSLLYSAKSTAVARLLTTTPKATGSHVSSPHVLRTALALLADLLHLLRLMVRSRTQHAHCERFVGTVRRECLDWLIPLNERHVRSVLAEWMSHYTVNDHIPRWVLDFPTTQPAKRH